MDINQVKFYRKKVGRILSYSLVISLFVIIAIGIGYKFAKKPFYFYNNRFDVVLTDSMSQKNQKYEEFLKDTKQIQAFDFVVSEKITDDTQLNVLDVVVFDNPDIGIDMHRIVEIGYVGDTFMLNDLSVNQSSDTSLFKFSSVASSIVSEKAFVYTDFEVVAYSENPFDQNEYYFNVNNVSVTPNVSSELQANGLFRSVISYHRDSLAPAKFSITKQNYEFNAEFEYIKLINNQTNYVIDANLVKQSDNGICMFNTSEKYLIRGDKSNTDDGWYERSELQSKVTMVIPKLGYVVRFLSSPFGTILLVGLMFIPITYWFIFDKKNKEE